MYEVDILENNNWEFYCESKDIKEIDKTVFKLTNERPNKFIRILQNDILLCWLDGTEYQYWYWKNKYVREKRNDFDYTKSYYQYVKKKKGDVK